MTHPFSVWFSVLLAPILLGMSSPAWAQGGPLPAARQAAEPRTFGTSSSTSHTLQAFAFTGLTPTDVSSLQSNGFGSRYCTTPCGVGAPLFLPAGARW